MTHGDQAKKNPDDRLVTPEGEEIDQSLLGTVKIDPDAYTNTSKNPDQLASTKYAIAGLLYLLVRERSIRVLAVLTVGVVLAGLWLGISLMGWALLVITLGMVWVTECLNTAIEAVIDIAAPEPHPLAKVGKDVAASATFISVIVFLLVVVLLLLPSAVRRWGW
ncbi:MAG: diacylglycerol kinase family protein [Chloroflexi bacterium]|nr:diacylglycerol kinase family protein [Chloroflexota bacterium]